MYEKDKRSFFEKLTGTINIEEEEEKNTSDTTDEEIQNQDMKITQDTEDPEKMSVHKSEEEPETDEDEEDSGEEGELSVDVYEVGNEIFVQAMIAGVVVEDIDISITREIIKIKGRRKNSEDVSDNNYYQKELYWGGFSRKILLPEEIDPELSEAIAKDGLLTLRLPKLNKKKSQKLEVKAL